jgi:hypothetical protein
MKQADLETQKFLSHQSHQSVEKGYCLGDSELIAKLIIDNLVQYAMWHSRMKFVDNHIIDFARCSVFSKIYLLENYSRNKFEGNVLSEYDLYTVPESSKCPIDNFASDYTKCQVQMFEDIKKVPIFHHNSSPPKKFTAIKGSEKKSKKKKDKEKSEKEKEKPDKIKTSEHLAEDDESRPSINSHQNAIHQKEIIKVQCDDIEDEINYYKFNNVIYKGENAERQAKNLKSYFDFKESERDRLYKKKKEEEQLKLKTEDKVKKFLSNPNNIQTLNFEGKLINLKIQDPSLLPSDPVPIFNFGNAKPPIKKNKIKRKTNLDEEKKENKDLLQELKEDKIYIESLKQNNEGRSKEVFFQPDPLVSIDPEKGVILVSNLKKKKGEEYNIEGRMSQAEFDQLAKELVVKESKNFEVDKRKSMESLLSAVHEESKAKTTKGEIQYTNILDQVPDIDDQDSIKTKMKKTKQMTQKIKSLPKINPINEAKINGKLAKSSSTINFRTTKGTSNIVSSKNYDYLKLPKFKEGDIYCEFDVNEMKNNEHKPSKTNLFVQPKSHGNLILELGKMKKYPRDRLSKDIQSSLLGKSTMKNEEKYPSNFKFYKK